MSRFHLVVLGVALLAALGLVVAPVASAATAPTPVAVAPFTLSANYTKYDALNTALDAKLPNVTVGTVMDNANLDRTALCHSTPSAGSPTGFCWDPDDDTNCNNTPQGITTSRDATGGTYSGHQVVATSWYYTSTCAADAPTTRSRITLTDWDATYPNKYRKILLVEPKSGPDGPTFADIAIHAGGISWYGDYLYVADTANGLRVFDMRKIWETDTTGSGIGLQTDGSYDAHAYRYVLPQIGTITDVGSTQLTWSTVALDRAKPSLVMGEFKEAAGSRAVRFPLDSATHKLKTGTDGLVHATEALSVPYVHVQGVVSHNGRWWFASSSDKKLYYWVPGSAAVAHAWVSWCESLSYWEDPNTADLLWTLRENQGDRNVFAVNQGSFS
jgi:LVIVD repeat-containing protein